MTPQAARQPLARLWHVLLGMGVLLVLAVIAAPMPVAHAGAPIVVNDTSGTVGGSGCTLRDAINAANTDAPSGGCPAGLNEDMIVLPAYAIITLTAQDNGTGSDINGLPAITTTITISGNHSIIQRSSAPATPKFRIFDVQSTGPLTLNNLTVRNGKSSVGAGGDSGYGGGIEISNNATVTLNNCTLSGNSTGDATGSAGSGWGGGIMAESTATLTINSCTITGNSTGTSVAGYNGNGGGIATNGAHLTITNSTISGNAVGQGGRGGGIYIYPHVDSITSSTITGNMAGDGGGIYVSGATVEVTLGNTIVAKNTAPTGPNCSGPVVNGGNNIDSGTGCGWGSSKGSMSDTDPLLGSLANNGGPTWTHAIPRGSPAIDGVTFNAPNGSPSTDQRGIARPQGARYDIGAYEAVLPKLILLPLILKSH